MSRAAILWLPASLLLVGCASPQADEAQLDAARTDSAEQAVMTFFDALEAMDFSALDSAVTRDFELVEDTLVLDLEGFVAFLEPFAEAGARITYSFSDFNTEVRGPVAWTRYRNDAVLVMNGRETELEWLESAVLLRTPEGWKVDRLQSAPVEAESEEP